MQVCLRAGFGPVDAGWLLPWPWMGLRPAGLGADVLVCSPAACTSFRLRSCSPECAASWLRVGSGSGWLLPWPWLGPRPAGFGAGVLVCSPAACTGFRCSLCGFIVLLVPQSSGSSERASSWMLLSAASPLQVAGTAEVSSRCGLPSGSAAADRALDSSTEPCPAAAEPAFADLAGRCCVDTATLIWLRD